MWSLLQEDNLSPSCPNYLSKTPNYGLNDPFQAHTENAILSVFVLNGKPLKSS